ncbi:MAG: hypothetical protein L3J35_02745 [Bacteroidales bacterium]|nr:hypothetical protein [Bacteroidales bacterium]
MKTIAAIFFTLLLSSFKISNLHPVHISIVNIDYKDSEKTFLISIKLFTDDFEKIVNKNFNTTINLGKTNETKDCNKYINKYIKKNFIFKVNKKNLFNTDVFVKKVNKDENSTWLYYKVKYNSGRKVSISNTILNDLYNDQKNLFIFTFKNTQEAYKFGKNKTNFEFLIK